jgi:hypothetical protein
MFHIKTFCKGTGFSGSRELPDLDVFANGRNHAPALAVVTSLLPDLSVTWTSRDLSFQRAGRSAYSGH